MGNDPEFSFIRLIIINSCATLCYCIFIPQSEAPTFGLSSVHLPCFKQGMSLDKAEYFMYHLSCPIRCIFFPPINVGKNHPAF